MIEELFLTFWAAVQWKLFWLLVAIAVDLILGVLIALFISKNFSWDELSRFLATTGVKLVAWFLVEFLAMMPAENLPEALQVIKDNFGHAVYLMFMASLLLGGVLKKLGELGLLPEGLSERLKL